MSYKDHASLPKNILKIAKKPSTIKTDRGDNLGFQEFIQSWVCYELVKVLNVFGLQPKIRPDLEAWSPDLFSTFFYLCNRSTSNTKDKMKAFEILDLLFDKTEHISYFGKMNFGSKEKFKTATYSSLYLLILTWLRQLEQYFYNFDGNDDFDGDWKILCYYFNDETCSISEHSHGKRR